MVVKRLSDFVVRNLQDGQLKVKNLFRVLMIEDDGHYRKFVQELLSKQTDPSFILTYANSIEEARESLEQSQANVILLDLNLPQSKGLTTLSKVQEIVPQCPIIVLTGSDNEELGLQAVSMGAHEYLVKQHISKDSLIRCIRYSIERHRVDQQRMRMAAIQDFTAMLAHDLKVPMLGAEKVLEALQTKQLGDLTETQEQVINSLRDANKNQLRLVQKLLEIYRYESGESSLDLREVDAAAILNDCVSKIASQKAVNITVKSDAEFTNTVTKGDEQALRQLFNNLLDNAIKYGDTTKAVNVSLQNSQNSLNIHIQNFGAPLPSGIQHIIFHKFWQGIPGKTYVANTGLGLYLCHRIAQLHRGNLSCKSNVEEGTIMTVRLPLMPVNKLVEAKN